MTYCEMDNKLKRCLKVSKFELFEQGHVFESFNLKKIVYINNMIYVFELFYNLFVQSQYFYYLVTYKIGLGV